MTDHFWSTVHNLLNLTEGRGDTPPAPSDGRVIRRLADFVAIQRTNPLEPQTAAQVLAIDFAEATVAWLDDPASSPQITQFKKTRADLIQAGQDDSGNR